MLKKFTNKKGFTLMEMLIVVAIIAVLVAIAIPTFTSALEKAKSATDLANIRSGYANAQISAITDEKTGTYILQADGTVKLYAAGVDGYKCAGSSDKAPSGSVGGSFAVNADGDTGVKWSEGANIYYTVTETSGVAKVTKISTTAPTT